MRFTIALSASLVAGATSLIVAQGGVHGSRPNGPATGPTPFQRPIGRRPFPPKTPVFGLPPKAWHRPIPFRSSFLGLVLFDPYWWWAPDATESLVPLPPAANPRLTGGIQLDVEPRRALVYVDGLFVGLVEDFSGYYHHLDTGAGWHLIEIVAPEYEPLITTVAVVAGQTTTYRGSLNRAPGRN